MSDIAEFIKPKAELMAEVFNENRKALLVEEFNLEYMQADILVIKNDAQFKQLNQQILAKKRQVEKMKEIVKKLFKEVQKYSENKIDL